tara:strand:+ start:266 stop:931 length:666 start_codon:yes stop_codon:yes gene_type:complete
MKLYKDDVSPFVRGIYKLVEKHNLDVEFVDVKLFEGEHLKDEYKGISRGQTVPSLVDGDIKIGQSNSILKYLCTKHNLPEYPQDVDQQREVNEMLDFLISDYHSFVHLLNNIVGILPFVTYSSESIHKEIKETSENKKIRYMNLLEERLSKNKFLCGDTETIADYLGFSIVSFGFMNKDFSLESFPNLEQWLGNFKKEVDEYKNVLHQTAAAIEQMRLQPA